MSDRNLTEALRGEDSDVLYGSTSRRYKVADALYAYEAVSKRQLDAATALVTYYVDAISGDDSNNGSSTAPLRSIVTAFNRAKRGAITKIMLKNNAPHIIDESVDVWGKTIIREGWGGMAEVRHDTFADQNYPNNLFYYRIHIGRSGVLYDYQIKIRTGNRLNDNPFDQNLYGGAPIMLEGGDYSAHKCDFALGNITTSLVTIAKYFRNSSIVFSFCNIALTSRYLVFNRDYAPFILGSFVNTLSADTSVIDQHVRYRKFKNDVCINVTSNLTF